THTHTDTETLARRQARTHAHTHTHTFLSGGCASRGGDRGVTREVASGLTRRRFEGVCGWGCGLVCGLFEWEAVYVFLHVLCVHVGVCLVCVCVCVSVCVALRELFTRGS